MNVRDAREGVAQRFSQAKAAASMRGAARLLDELGPTTSAEDTAESATHRDTAASVASRGFKVRHGTRSGLLRAHDVYVLQPSTSTSPGASPGVPAERGNTLPFTGKTYANAAVALIAEVHRRCQFHQVLARLHKELDLVAAEVAGSTSASPSNVFMTPTQREELSARWVMQSLDSLPEEAEDCGAFPLLVRHHVTALDVGATVLLRVPEEEAPSTVEAAERKGAKLWVVTGAAPMAAGQYWVDVAPYAAGEDSATSLAQRRVSREAVRLHPPTLTHLDAFLPCDDAFSPRGTSACLFLATLLAITGTGIGRRPRCPGPLPPPKQQRREPGKEGPRPQEMATQLATRMGDVTRAARAALHATCVGLAELTDTHSEGTVASVQATLAGREQDMLRLTWHTAVAPLSSATQPAKGLEAVTGSVEVLCRTAEKLARMYDRAAAEHLSGCEQSSVFSLLSSFLDTSKASPSTPSTGTALAPALEIFFTRLTTMLLRYQLLFGDKGYNQGPQAAIPPSIMSALHHSFDVQAEGFASPLNAQLPVYGSLFPDTDRYFGSLGSFFDVELASGQMEVNPPFDAVVMERMQHRLLTSLAAAEAKGACLLFVVVLPSHDLDPQEKATAGQPPRAPALHSSGPEHATAKRNEGLTESRPAQKRPRDEPATPAASEARHTIHHATAPGPTGKMSTDRALRESPFCLAHTLCAAAASAYVDGHQHLLRAPFFCIGTPTRLIVLGTAAARARYPDASARLEAIRAAWRTLTTEELHSDK